MENKKFKVEFEGSNLVLKVDMNKDGDSSVEMKLKLAEILDEVGYMIVKKDEE